MTETVVHVTTLEQWKSVLDVWFKQGFSWYSSIEKYNEKYFRKGERYLLLDHNNDILKPTPGRHDYIEYSDFIAQKKEDNKMAMVYEVSQSVFDELQMIKAHEGMSLIGAIAANTQLIKSIEVGNKAILRYLADDPAIKFKVKEQLYRLWRIDDRFDKVYMTFNDGTPDWDYVKDIAFTAPLEEINKWQTPAWSLEKVD